MDEFKKAGKSSIENCKEGFFNTDVKYQGRDSYAIKNICSFYVGSAHLITKILPYIKEQINLNTEFSTFLEYNLTENVQQILSKLMKESNIKENILNINWNTSNAYKFATIEKS